MRTRQLARRGSLTEPDGRLVDVVASVAVVVASTVLRFVSVGSVHRTLVGSARSAIGLGLVDGPLRWIGLLAVLVLPVMAVWIGCAALAGRRPRVPRGLVLAVGGLSSCGALLVSRRPTLGSTVLLMAVVSLTWSAVLGQRNRGARHEQVTRSSDETADSPEHSSAHVGSQVPGRTVAAVAGVGVVATAVLVVWSAGAVRPGASSPRAAADRFAEALRVGDNLRVVELLDPYERDVVVAEGPRLLTELRRLGVITRSGAVGEPAAAGVSVSLGGVEPIADGLSGVRVSGRLHVPRVLIRSLGADTTRVLQEPGQLVAVRRDGRWYVSVLHTAAEHERRLRGLDVPAELTQSRGAPNPEAAVRQLLSAVSAVDLGAAIAVMDPHEAAVLHRYGAMFEGDVDRLRRWSEVNATWTFPDVGLSSSVDGSRATVRITRLSAQLDLPSDFGVGSRAVLDGDCVRVTIEQETSRHCGTEIPRVVGDLFGATAPDLGDLAWLSTPTDLLEIVVTRRGSSWYVAPFSSAADSAVIRLRAYEPADLQGDGNDLAARLRRVADHPLTKLITGR